MAKPVDIIKRGTRVAQPTPSANAGGTLYYVTDENIMERWSGTAWESVAEVSGGAGSDTTAIHDNVASEISAVTEKTTPIGADMGMIEDSAAANVKKMVQLSNWGKAIKLDDLATPDDNTDLNATTGVHGLLKKLSGTATQYMDGAGNWTTPAGAGSDVTSITFVIDGGGSAITAGIKGDLEIPFACTINQVTLLADQSGSIVIDIWKDTYANFPPIDADSITASAPPTITTATKSQDATLTGWTTSITAGDILRFNVDSATTIQRVTLALKVTKT